MKRMAVRPGFSLVEAVVALTFMAVVVSAMVPAFANNVRINTVNEIRTGAVAVAQQEVDNLRALSTWPTSGQSRTITTGLGNYTSTLWHQPYCNGGVCFAGARHVTVEVSLNGRAYYRVETVFTTLDPT